MHSLFLFLHCVVGVSVAQTVTIDPVGNVTAAEGNNLTITCTDGVARGSSFSLRENGVELTENDEPPNEEDGMTRIFRLPVNRTQDGYMYDCQSVVTTDVSPAIVLRVTWIDSIDLYGTSSTVDEADTFVINITFVASTRPNITLERQDGQPIPDPTRISVTDVSINTSRLSFRGLRVSDAGNYLVRVEVNGDIETQTISLTVNPTPPPPIPPVNVIAIAVGITAGLVVLLIIIGAIVAGVVLFVRWKKKRSG